MINKCWIGAALLMALGICATPTRAMIIEEQFEDPIYGIGAPLSNVWNNADNTAGVYTIENVGGAHHKVVRMDANGPSPGPGFPLKTAEYLEWGGPDRADGALWFSVDIEKGTSPDGSPLSSNVWQLQFVRPSRASFLFLQGGLGTVQLKGSGGTYTTGSIGLANGWNTVVVMNDLTRSPNTRMWLNGTLVGSFDATTGAASSTNSYAEFVQFVQLPRGGTGDNLVGSMRFDNLITANEPLLEIPEPATLVLLGMGLVPAVVLIHRRRRRV